MKTSLLLHYLHIRDTIHYQCNVW